VLGRTHHLKYFSKHITKQKYFLSKTEQIFIENNK